MPKFTFTSPEGKSYTVEGPPGATREQAFSLLSQRLSVGAAQPDNAPGVLDQVRAIHQADEVRNPLTRLQRGVTESIGAPAASLAGGAAGAVVGGVEGLARGIGAGAASLAQGEGLAGARQAFANEGAETIERRAQQFQPTAQSPTEARAMRVASVPFAAIEAGTDVLGRETAEATGSPALGAGVKAGANFALGRFAGRALERGQVGKVGRGTAPPGSAAGPAGTPPQPPPGMSASGPPRPPMSDLGGGAAEVPRGTPPPGPAGGTTAAQPPPGPAVQGGTPGGPRINPEQTQRAQDYARSIGLDWANLGAGTRAALENIAQDAGALDRLNPAQVRRHAHLQSQRIPVPATRAQITLDPVDARAEALAARTSEGGRIRDVDLRANAAIQGNLEALRGRVGGLRGGLHEPTDAEGNPAATPSIRRETGSASQVGGGFQKALREKAKWSEKAYQALYKTARETEPEARADVAPLHQLFESNPEVQHLGWVQSWLNKAARTGKVGESVSEEGKLTHATLAELQDLRSDATAIARTGGKEGFYAGKVVKAIDQVMNEVPEGAKAWKAANEAFRKHKAEFENQGAVKRLVANKKGSPDPLTAAEKTTRRVALGSVEEIRQVKRSALTGGTPATRAAGRAAWRQVRADVVNDILESARQVVATDESERAILTAAALNKSIKRYPRENLEEIIGKKNTKELYGILRARKLTKGRTTESGTVPNILVLAEKVLKHVPFGHYAEGALKAGIKVGELGKAGRDANRAITTPLEEAGEQASRSAAGRAKRRAELYRSIEGEGPTLGDIP